jgi:hypothetical protein
MQRVSAKSEGGASTAAVQSIARPVPGRRWRFERLLDRAGVSVPEQTGEVFSREARRRFQLEPDVGQDMLGVEHGFQIDGDAVVRQLPFSAAALPEDYFSLHRNGGRGIHYRRGHSDDSFPFTPRPIALTANVSSITRITFYWSNSCIAHFHFY